MRLVSSSRQRATRRARAVRNPVIKGGGRLNPLPRHRGNKKLPHQRWPSNTRPSWKDCILAASTSVTRRDLYPVGGAHSCIMSSRQPGVPVSPYNFSVSRVVARSSLTVTNEPVAAAALPTIKRVRLLRRLTDRLEDGGVQPISEWSGCDGKEFITAFY